MNEKRTALLPYLKSIIIYPIKSLDGVSVDVCKITALGALENDRRFMMVDGDGTRLNGKKFEMVTRIRCEYNLETMTVAMALPGKPKTEPLSLIENRQSIEHILGNYFGCAINLVEDTKKGFPDDVKANGPTIVSEASLDEVQKWYPELSVEQIKKRFRVNLIVGGVEPFWEDRLYGAVEEAVSFTIGDIHFSGINPCQRCVVPSRDSETGERTENFQKIFMQQREQTLPAWVDKNRFNHYYRFTTNTKVVRIVEPGFLSCGDIVTL